MSKTFWSELLRIVTVIAIALTIGFVITALVSKEPIKAYSALLTGPFPRISFENGFERSLLLSP